MPMLPAPPEEAAPDPEPSDQLRTGLHHHIIKPADGDLIGVDRALGKLLQFGFNGNEDFFDGSIIRVGLLIFASRLRLRPATR